MEYIAVSFDEERKIAKLSLKGFETLEQLEKEEHDAIAKKQPLVASWKPEYATYMLEGKYYYVFEFWISVMSRSCEFDPNILLFFRSQVHLAFLMVL